MAQNNPVPSPAALAWAEEILASWGIAVVPREIAELADRILANPEAATAEEYEAVLFAIHACPWPEPRPVFA